MKDTPKRTSKAMHQHATRSFVDVLRDARDARTFCECVGRPLPLLETRRIALSSSSGSVTHRGPLCFLEFKNR